jgi:predicted dehydrogenase
VTARALIVGYGSIGQRHAAVLEGLGAQVAVVSRRGEGGGRPVYPSVAEARQHGEPDYIVIANQSAEHIESLGRLAEADYRGVVLVEKPLFAAPSALPRHAFSRAGVGYNLRFHPVVRALREALRGRNAQMADFHVGQWLSDWRAGRDARATYSSSREAGGGVLRDLSHELDLATWLFGDWSRVTALGGRLGSVTVDADDGWGILLACERCPVVNIHLDCLARSAHRSIAVHVDGETLRADLIGNTLQAGKDIVAIEHQRDESYRSMHRALLSDSSDVCRLAEGLRTVELIAAVEEAAQDRRWIGRVA